MFKSLFSKKSKNTPSEAESRDGRQASRGSLAEPVQRPLDQVLKPLISEFNPGDPDDYIVSEVECLWARFLQIASDGSSTISDEVFREQTSLHEPFIEQIWKTIPRDENGDVTFQAFVGIIKWWHSAPLGTKIRSSFKLLNKSRPLDGPALERILQKLDPSADDETIKRKTELLINELDDKGQGFIDEDQWTKFVLQLPEQDVKNLVTFNILPPDEQPTQPRTTPSFHSEIPNDIIIDIAGQIGEDDWTPLATQLGFTANDVHNIQLQFAGRSREQAYQMLIKWVQKKGRSASVAELQTALKDCGMDDIAVNLET